MARCQDKNGIVSTNGFFQEVPGVFGSRSLANTYPSGMVGQLALVGGTSSYVVQLPPNALVKDFTFSVVTGFNGTTPTLTVGSSAGASDMLAAQSLASTTASCPACLKPNAHVATGKVYVTLNGSSTTGAGYLFITFVPALAPLPV